MTRKEFKAKYDTLINAILNAWKANTPDGPSRLDMDFAAEAFCNACFHGCIPDGDEADIKAALSLVSTGSPDYNDPYIRAKADRYYKAFEQEYHELEDVLL